MKLIRWWRGTDSVAESCQSTRRVCWVISGRYRKPFWYRLVSRVTFRSDTFDQFRRVFLLSVFFSFSAHLFAFFFAVVVGLFFWIINWIWTSCQPYRITLVRLNTVIKISRHSTTLKLSPNATYNMGSRTPQVAGRTQPTAYKLQLGCVMFVTSRRGLLWNFAFGLVSSN